MIAIQSGTPLRTRFSGWFDSSSTGRLRGESYRSLTRYQELAEPFELEHIPDESVLSRTWHNRFDNGVREFVQSTAHFVIKEVHNREFSVPAVRPKSDVDNKKTVTVGELDRGFYIADDGPGIAMSDRDKAFERGYTTTTENTGFGLAIVETIAEAHGWNIRITDSADGGAQFEITGVNSICEQNAPSIQNGSTDTTRN